MTEDEMLSKYPQTRGTPIARHLAVALLAIVSLLPFAGCGGQGGDSGSATTGTLAFRALWQQSPALSGTAATANSIQAQTGGGPGFGTEIPPSVKTIQVTVLSDGTGEQCCLAFSPAEAPDREIALFGIPDGQVSVRLRGFPTNAAPGPPGAALCRTTADDSTAPTVGRLCGGAGGVTPSFDSDEKKITVHGTSDAGDIELFSKPFILEDRLTPAPDTVVASPAVFDFYVVDAAEAIQSDSISLGIGGTPVTPSELSRTPCSDFTPTPCSADASLQVTGVHVTTSALAVPDEAVTVSITADNTAGTSVDRRYDLNTDVQPCDIQTRAGGDAPFEGDFELVDSFGTIVFDYEAFSIKDRFIVTYEGATLFDSGCVSGSISQPITYSGTSSRVHVRVEPNCEGTRGTAWNFTVRCPSPPSIGG